MVVLYVLDVPGFLPIVENARKMPDCRIVKSEKGYWKVVSPTEIVLNRKNMKMSRPFGTACSPAVNREIVEFGRDTVRVISTDGPLVAVRLLIGETTTSRFRPTLSGE